MSHVPGCAIIAVFGGGRPCASAFGRPGQGQEKEPAKIGEKDAKKELDKKDPAKKDLDKKDADKKDADKKDAGKKDAGKKDAGKKKDDPDEDPKAKGKSDPKKGSEPEEKLVYGQVITAKLQRHGPELRP